jgi:hypothetical protein
MSVIMTVILHGDIRRIHGPDHKAIGCRAIW